MNSFLYMLEGKAAVGPGKGDKEQIDAHNTITLTKVCWTPPDQLLVLASISQYYGFPSLRVPKIR